MDPKFEKVSRNARRWMNGDSMICRLIRNFFEIEEVHGCVNLEILQSLSTEVSGPCRIADYDNTVKLTNSYKTKFRNLQGEADGFVFYVEGDNAMMYPEARQLLMGNINSEQ